ncbi:Pumilio domain-containing protein C14orf21 [Chelonia mydas]|uniref:Pumilio domain-containing protein C14orf21 n=1 Tax=Chelonia mydas TaxID=8469 RepID=M7AYF1_CHEMY|nr:Pumilio domain-containing protein C14orf21 [Chelonia mydas]
MATQLWGGGGQRQEIRVQTLNLLDLKERRGLFVTNVLEEAVGSALPLALDPSGSLLLQALLPEASPTQLAQLLCPLLPALRQAACHPCGAHVLEAALLRAPRLLGREGAGKLEELVLQLGGAVREELGTFARDPHASFVVRTLLQVLGGVRVGSDAARGLSGTGPPAPRKKRAEAESEGPVEFEVPDSFLALLQEFIAAFQENIAEFITHRVASLCLQVALEVLHRKLPEACAELCSSVIGYLSSRNPSAGCRNGVQQVVIGCKVCHDGAQRLLSSCLSPLLVFLKDPVCSRVLDKVLEVSARRALRALYRQHFRGQLRALAGHGAFHCWEPPTRRVACAPLFASLLPYEVYYALGEGQEVQPPLEEQPDPPPALASVSLHGSLLLQHLLHFADPSPVLRSLAALPPSDLVTLACSPAGSHVYDALLASPSVPRKPRRKVLRGLQGHYVSLACNKHGSRVLDAIWSRATLPAKRQIAQELAEQEKQLRNDPFGHHLVRNFALTHFLNRRRDWDRHQEAETKRKELFAEILED